ncbi:MAG TPA: non-ribosomal peptide synthetase [Rudaea sp.]|jgi:amino acid adenylation domain-containing protein
MNAVAEPELAAPVNALLARVAAHAAVMPQATAVVCGNDAFSYADLAGTASGLMRAFDSLGMCAGEIVAFSAERSAENIALMLAALAYGCAYLPLEQRLDEARIATMIHDAQPRLVVTDPAMRACLASIGAAVENVERRGKGQGLVLKPNGPIAYVLFTSGSTGSPKGVAMSTAGVAGLISWHQRHPRLGRSARTLQFAPLGFDVSFQEIFSTLATAGTLVLASDEQRRDPWELLALLRREHVERIFLPYVALQSLAGAVAADPDLLPKTLTDVVTAGEQLRITPAIRALFAMLPDCVLHNHYGPTETHVVTSHELSGNSAAWPELPPIGRTLPHVVAAIDALDSTGGEGELLLGGSCLAAGYVGGMDANAQRFVTQGGRRWYRTGDLVRGNVFGELTYLGRVDTQIKVAGHRIDPAEIEAVLGRHARVVQAAVVAHGVGAEARLVAHVVPSTGDGGTGALEVSLRQHCVRSLPSYLVPQHFVLHVRLPTTDSGKVDRLGLLRNPVAGTGDWDEHGSVAANVARLWQRLLADGNLAPTDNLFDRGATSLVVVQALTELRSHGLLMSVGQIYEHPTVARQSELLEGATGTKRTSRQPPRSPVASQAEVFERFAPARASS